MLQYYLSLIENEQDKDKLENLYNTYYDLMISVAMKFVHNKEIAMDVVHDVILKVIKHLDDIDESDPFKTKSYLCTIVKNQAIDLIRRNNAFSPENIDDVEYMLEDEAMLPVEQIIREDGYERLVGYIDLLNDTYRTVCQLKYINGMKESEIADTLNLPPKTVNMRIFRGRQLLKKMITESVTNDKQ